MASNLPHHLDQRATDSLPPRRQQGNPTTQGLNPSTRAFEFFQIFNNRIIFFSTKILLLSLASFLVLFVLKDGKCANAHLRGASAKGGAEIMSTNPPHNLAQRATGSLPGRDCLRAPWFYVNDRRSKQKLVPFC